MNVIVHHSENIISCILIHSNVKHEIPPSLFFVKYVRYSREHFQVNYSIIWKDESKMNLYIFHSRNWKIIMLYFARHLKSKKKKFPMGNNIYVLSPHFLLFKECYTFFTFREIT